ncbi:tetratricopeptide repeat protein [Geodermatophilus sp. CPCC 205761]|uniref:tetratricopeptide repeat protein n=1 Tax=Geodermatophilus sp. CPCC 205761 TaxID=2936597 RepID=UPI003EE90A0A
MGFERPDDRHPNGPTAMIPLQKPVTFPAEAIRLSELTIAEAERRLGAGHLEAIDVKHNLALVHAARGEPVQAVALLEEAAASAVGGLRNEHPETLAVLADLAVAQVRAGRTALGLRKAEDLLPALIRLIHRDLDRLTC